jgi:hypothetical protein
VRTQVLCTKCLLCFDNSFEAIKYKKLFITSFRSFLDQERKETPQQSCNPHALNEDRRKLQFNERQNRQILTTLGKAMMDEMMTANIVSKETTSFVLPNEQRTYNVTRRSRRPSTNIRLG